MKTKSQPDVLQAWLATQDLPPLDRQYMKYAAANDNEVFKMVMGNHDWMVVTPSNAKSGWGKILNMRMVKTWSFAELCDSRIAPQNKPLQELPFQQKLTWRDGVDIVLMLLLFTAFLFVAGLFKPLELYVWFLGLYCCLSVCSIGAKWCRVRAQFTPLKLWQSWFMITAESALLRGVLSLSLAMFLHLAYSSPWYNCLNTTLGPKLGLHWYSAAIWCSLVLTNG